MIFSQKTGFWIEPTPDEMKTASKNGKSRVNGRQFTRKELLAAHERALKRLDRMTLKKGLQPWSKPAFAPPTAS